MKIKVSDIYYNADWNCRREFTLQSVKDLADSIKELGRLICPVMVRPWDKDGFKYHLIVGHRRFQAVTRFLRWTEIPAIVVKGLSEHDAKLLNISENLERAALNIWEEALALQSLYTGSEITVAAMAAELKKSKQWILVRRRLLTMPEAIQKQAASGLLSQINLLELSRLDREEQLFAAEKIADARSRNTGGKHLRGLDSKYRSRRMARKRPEINKMIETLFGIGISGFPTRCLAWAAFQISDEELLADCKPKEQQ